MLVVLVMTWLLVLMLLLLLLLPFLPWKEACRNAVIAPGGDSIRSVVVPIISDAAGKRLVVVATISAPILLLVLATGLI